MKSFGLFRNSQFEDPMLNLTLRHALAFAALLTLAACGADGPPEAPAKTGITISGEAAIGITT